MGNSRSINITFSNICALCLHWVGRCLHGKKNRIASQSACEYFIPRLGHEYE